MLKHKIEDLSQILGGGLHQMSSVRNGNVTATDSAELTCRHGNGWKYYGGQPGDGHAGDWYGVKWSDGLAHSDVVISNMVY